MKKNIVIKLLGTLFIVSFFVLLFMRVNTDIYVWNYSDFSIPIDIQLKIDDKLIFKDSLRSSSFFPNIIIRMKLRYGVHKIEVLSKKADINQKSKILLLPNQYIFVGFSGTDTLTLKKKVFKEENDSVDVSQELLVKKMPGYRQPKFLIESKFNPFNIQ
ncbi:hypothetical protein INE81_02054 [Bacteroides salyersiae]|uniref:hypothetical protein n=2 Tax=Bacteroides salyersiae TaxID=291644 RepID=UPI001B8AAD7F|nr:hypothetical protein [Bacteroides salyersiae]MCS2404938.1 hypothetical protein [Bacteroides salyersiae]QUT75594.1 hypothetical protein INE81_02054 [Bacteroides salyersiae]